MKTVVPGVEGWYPDPHAKGFERYWDGRAWTPASRPAQRSAGGSKARVGIIVAVVVAVLFAGGILAFFALAKPAVEQQAQIVDEGKSRAYDTAAKNDALKLGTQLQIYYVDHEGAPPAVTVTAARYVFAGDSTLGQEPVSAGVTYGGATGSGAADWCVWVETTDTSQSAWNYSAAGGLAAGRCG